MFLTLEEKIQSLENDLQAEKDARQKTSERLGRLAYSNRRYINFVGEILVWRENLPKQQRLELDAILDRYDMF